MKEHRKYIKWYEDFHVARVFIDRDSSLYVYNKIDSVSLDFLDKLAREPHTVVMSCELDLGIQDVVERCWQELQLMRIYTKRYKVFAGRYLLC
jgi:ribosome-interacting GTPase 1